MTDTTKQKRANFSALTPTSNGVNRTPSIVSLKPGAAKKLTIKNLKGKFLNRVLSIAGPPYRFFSFNFFMKILKNNITSFIALINPFQTSVATLNNRF